MKTKIIMLLIIIISSDCYSQIIKSIGFKSGITLSNQNWQHSRVSIDYNILLVPGIFSAITADFISKENISISADIGYYQSSGKTEYNPFNYPLYKFFHHVLQVNSVINFGFLSFCPNIKLKKTINAFTPYFTFGPRIDYYYSKLSNSNANIFKDQITKKPIWGLTIGNGVSYKLHNFSINLEYLFMYSFKNIIDLPGDYFIDPKYGIGFDVDKNTLKTSTHIISLGLIYHFNRTDPANPN